jgi:hypothetical protein
MSWGGVWATWDGGDGLGVRNLKGRLEPGTSVANGSMFDNIRRGWGREAGWRPGGSNDASLSSTSRSTAKRLGVSRKKKKTGFRIFHQDPRTVGPTIPPTKPH